MTYREVSSLVISARHEGGVRGGHVREFYLLPFLLKWLKNYIFHHWCFKTCILSPPLFQYSHACMMATQPTLCSLFPTHMPPDMPGRELHSTECTLPLLISLSGGILDL